MFKLLRVTSYCIRFITGSLKVVVKKREARRNTLNRFLILNLFFMNTNLKYTSLIVSANEIVRSRCFIVYIHQSTHFSTLMHSLKAGKGLVKSSPLLKMNHFMDGDLIRVGGRLANAQIPNDNKHSFLLHNNDAFTRLLIAQTHSDTFHGGVHSKLGTIRLQYWIVKGRIAVKSFVKNCVRCRIFSKRGCTQLMGNLPSERTTSSKPFEVAGVDYAGPIKVRLAKVRGSITQKGYIAIFVCFFTHAIHIEVVEDYSSASFIAAFHRFTSRRGHVMHLHSDHGTTFVGAESALRQMLQGSVDWSKRLQNKLTEIGTQWHFNPPGVPHFGGLWESAVKSMKFHIYRLIGEQALTFIELSTLLCRIEAILNSRPLLPLVDEISDLNPLTPSHFLIHRPSFFILEQESAFGIAGRVSISHSCKSSTNGKSRKSR